MNNMNKVEITKAVAEKTGLHREDAKEAVDAVFSAISEGLSSGEKVVIPGFGTFSTVYKEDRAYNHPITGERAVSPAHYAVKFKSGTKLAESING